MAEQKTTTVGILRFGSILACIQALEKLEKETQTIVEQTPDSQLDEKWSELHALAVDARGALGAFRLVAKQAEQINANPSTSYTIEWRGSLEKALDAMGLSRDDKEFEGE